MRADCLREMKKRSVITVCWKIDTLTAARNNVEWLELDSCDWLLREKRVEFVLCEYVHAHWKAKTFLPVGCAESTSALLLHLFHFPRKSTILNIFWRIKNSCLVILVYHFWVRQNKEIEIDSWIKNLDSNYGLNIVITV